MSYENSLREIDSRISDLRAVLWKRPKLEARIPDNELDNIVIFTIDEKFARVMEEEMTSLSIQRDFIIEVMATDAKMETAEEYIEYCLESGEKLTYREFLTKKYE